MVLEKVKERDRRLWYAEECSKNGWLKAIHVHKIIKNNLIKYVKEILNK